MTGREQVTVQSFEELIVVVTRMVHATGASGMEFRYSVLDAAGEPVDPQPEKAGEGDVCRWEAITTRRIKVRGRRPFDHTVIGTAVSDRRGHKRAMSLAMIDLLEKLGANTVVIDMGDDTDPRDTPFGNAHSLQAEVHRQAWINGEDTPQVIPEDPADHGDPT